MVWSARHRLGARGSSSTVHRIVGILLFAMGAAAPGAAAQSSTVSGQVVDSLTGAPLVSAHVHFVVSAPGYKDVITHLFDAESDYLDSDAVFGVRDSLIVDMAGGACTYDFVLEPA